MRSHPRCHRQLPLALDLPDARSDVVIPTDLEQEVIGALATLLLEAAGVLSGTDAGGADEPEDYS